METTTIENLPVEDSVVTTAPEMTGMPQVPALSRGMMIGLGIALVLLTGVAGYYAGRYSKLNAPVVTPTPTPTPTATAEVTPTLTEAPTVEVTETATPTPTVATVKKTAKIKEQTNSYTLKFTMDVPTGITVSETKIGSWNGILLRKGTKAMMAFNLPYELYENQGYSSLTNVSSSITDLKRVRAKKPFQTSGSYSFAVAYVTPTSLFSGTDCTAPVISNVTTSPCAMPAVTYSADIGFGAYCSVDPTYLAICDKIMKTIVVVKE